MKRIQFRNDWERHVYEVDGKSRVGIKKVRINGTVFDAISRETSVMYPDHGHIYESVSDHLFVVMVFEGIQFESPLYKLLECPEKYDIWFEE